MGRIDTTASYAQEVQSLYAVYEKRKFNDALIDDLKLIGSDLNKNVYLMVERVTKERTDFFEHYDQMHDYDSYKEQMYADRAEGSGISDMFGSLPDND